MNHFKNVTIILLIDIFNTDNLETIHSGLLVIKL